MQNYYVFQRKQNHSVLTRAHTKQQSRRCLPINMWGSLKTQYMTMHSQEPESQRLSPVP